MVVKFCCTCIHWEKVAPNPKDAFGICSDVGVSMKISLEGESDNLSSNGTFWTDAYFGCIYWRENDGSLFDVEEEIPDLLEKPKHEFFKNCVSCQAANNILNEYCEFCKAQF